MKKFKPGISEHIEKDRVRVRVEEDVQVKLEMPSER